MSFGEILAAVAVIYGFVALFALIIGLLMTTDGRVATQRTGARIALLCWCWPVLLVVGLVNVIRELWEMAEWGDR